MSRVEEIELQVQGLNEEELRVFRAWFAEYDAEMWDRQIEQHAADETLARIARACGVGGPLVRIAEAVP